MTQQIESLSDEAVRERVESLLAEMTVAEKAGQLTQYFYMGFMRDHAADGAPSQPDMVDAALARSGVGSLLFLMDPTEINRLQKSTIEGNRLGIPALVGFDVIHGFRTIFPVPIAVAASWDPDVAEQGQAVAAREARAVGIHWAFAPMVDIARDPRWGRIIEGAGEDPYLGGKIAAGQVRGFQGESISRPDRLIAGPKHFAGYGASLGGRDYDESNISDAELWNIYFPPFKAAIDAGAGNVMSAYMDLNGVPAAGNSWLLNDVLRGALGFEGFVVSDAQAVHDLTTHHFAADLADAATRALNAGNDMEMTMVDPAFDHLVAAVEDGRVSIETLDTSVRRVLTAKVRLGLFESPYVDEARAAVVLADPAHREVAKLAGQRSAVLLRNEESLLPLSTDTVSSIAVIGALADSERDILGPWVFNYDLAESVTVLDGIKARAGESVDVRYAPGVRPVFRQFRSIFDAWPHNIPEDPEGFDEDAELAKAAELAANSDVAVVVAGEWQHLVGENASRSTLELPGRQLELIQAVVATGTPVVLLVMNGRPLDLRWPAQNVPAILDIWYPGTSGGHAVAALLFGDDSPGGKLPFTWPRSGGHVPMIYNHTRGHKPQDQGERYWDEESTPLFPFGYGLSYGSFSYSAPTLSSDSIAVGESLSVSVTVTNEGSRDADEVVQLYLHQRHGTSSRPVRELKGFQRVAVAAGESATVEFTLGPDELSYWSAVTRDWVQDATTFDLGVGGDSSVELGTQFTVV